MQKCTDDYSAAKLNCFMGTLLRQPMILDSRAVLADWVKDPWLLDGTRNRSVLMACESTWLDKISAQHLMTEHP